MMSHDDNIGKWILNKFLEHEDSFISCENPKWKFHFAIFCINSEANMQSVLRNIYMDFFLTSTANCAAVFP